MVKTPHFCLKIPGKVPEFAPRRPVPMRETPAKDRLESSDLVAGTGRPVSGRGIGLRIGVNAGNPRIHVLGRFGACRKHLQKRVRVRVAGEEP